MERKNPFSFISLSALIHVGILFGLALIPWLSYKSKEKPPAEITTMEIPSAPPAVSDTVQPPVSNEPTIAKQPALDTKPITKLEQSKKIQTPPPKRTSPSQSTAAMDAKPQPLPEKTLEKSEETPNQKEEIVQPTVENAQETSPDKTVSEEKLPNDEKAAQEPALSPTSTSSSNGSNTTTPAQEGPMQSYTDLRQSPGNHPPSYPTQARRNGWQGEVILNYYVTPQGLVKDVSVSQSSGFPILDQEAIRAVKQYKFTQGQEGWTQHPVIFSLKGESIESPGQLRSTTPPSAPIKGPSAEEVQQNG
ncbi:MAG: TonB family protein [Bdellovibrionales bacterium]|nr:TonB family protein [Bdellovibrionales bacterium]